MVGDAGAVIDEVNIDSRIVEPGQLFVPIVAERDGHAFIGKAVDAGATVYLSSDTGTDVPGRRSSGSPTPPWPWPIWAARPAPGCPTGSSASPARWQDLHQRSAGRGAGHHVSDSGEREVVQQRTRPADDAGERPDDTEAVVLEMGARGVGHIELLCGIGRPTVGVITRVESVHLEMFGSLEAVSRPGRADRGPSDNGVAVLNADDPVVAAMSARASAPVLTYGLSASADVYASAVSLDDELRASFRLHSPWGESDVQLGARGEHQVPNALAAAAAGGGVGVPVEQIVLGLRSAALSGLRMELVTTPGGVIVINDAYNANPTSMTAALNSLATLRAGRRIAVLGTMAELGDDSDAAHAGVTRTALDLGVG